MQVSSIAVTVTYVPYICAEIPSNLVIAKVGARRLIPGLCISWGLVTTLQCRVQSFGGLVACRFFLGLCEGGLIPGIMVYLASFYRRHELQLRVCIFFGFSALAGAFSGLLAAAIVNLHGVGGMEGWRWIFLLEGWFFHANVTISQAKAMICRAVHRRFRHCGTILDTQQSTSGPLLQRTSCRILREKTQGRCHQQ